MKPIITLTASMKSSRLPFKIMRYLKDKPLIEQLIERLQLSKLNKGIVLCITTNSYDDILVDIAEKYDLQYIRKPIGQVLESLSEAAKLIGATHIVGVTADNPLIDPKYVDTLIEFFKIEDPDYVSCKDLPLGTYPYGLKVEALNRVLKTTETGNSEIWGHFFEKDPSINCMVLPVEEELQHPELRLTVDYPEDLELMRIIFDKFYNGLNNFKLKNVVRFILGNKKVFDINKNILRGTHQGSDTIKLKK